ncbi:Hypothetical protein NTJ_11574 [Nesidiocoris tenuis]|uniref:Uncharacterized protein n=1 Tax=Nesidiocoris tenuis TaxID=355587 RepID=A0ABN7B584_9HEMI|nr:Hypothetical protein NTJ_11574 [Nesidiocoris tenuis]
MSTGGLAERLGPLGRRGSAARGRCVEGPPWGTCLSLSLATSPTARISTGSPQSPPPARICLRPTMAPDTSRGLNRSDDCETMSRGAENFMPADLRQRGDNLAGKFSAG